MMDSDVVFKGGKSRIEAGSGVAGNLLPQSMFSMFFFCPSPTISTPPHILYLAPCLPQSLVSLSVYQQMLLLAILMCALVIIHWCLLAFWRWKWPLGQKALPAWLVFPR